MPIGALDPRLLTRFNPYALGGLVARYDLSDPLSLTTTTANFTGTGTATATLASTAFTGSSTAFLSELAPGDSVFNSSDVLIGVIASVSSDTAAVLVSNGAVAITSAAFHIRKAAARISQINDKSGNGRHLTQATPSKMPTYLASGLISALFDGVNDYMSVSGGFTLAQPETVYWCGQQVTWGGTHYVYDGGVNNSMALFQRNATPQVAIYSGTTVLLIQSPTLPLLTPGVITGVFNGAKSAVRINKLDPKLGDLGNTTGANGFSLGRSGTEGGAAGNLMHSESLIFATAHDVSTQNRVIRFLAKKWGIAA